MFIQLINRSHHSNHFTYIIHFIWQDYTHPNIIQFKHNNHSNSKTFIHEYHLTSACVELSVWFVVRVVIVQLANWSMLRWARLIHLIRNFIAPVMGVWSSVSRNVLHIETYSSASSFVHQLLLQDQQVQVRQLRLSVSLNVVQLMNQLMSLLLKCWSRLGLSSILIIGSLYASLIFWLHPWQPSQHV